ncbi:hypothetical protein H8S88_04635 [Streptococcus sp. GS001]|nr:hypothetical protein [Streptococcus sp. GS001]MCF4964627.1 hypothetical protein [Streptococcus sp. GS001]
MNEAKVTYQICAKNVDDAIDMKNKILANTVDKENIQIEISINNAYVIS